MDLCFENFIQSNSPDGGFLQSEYWRKFQEAWGRRTYNISEIGGDEELIALANIITHKLPVVGDYLYVPRGPVFEISNFQFPISKQLDKFLSNLIDLAKENNANWIRIEPGSGEILQAIRKSLPKNVNIKKSSVDMQPREILVLDISKSETEILAGMKQKTRYNIKLSQKHGVSVKAISNFQFPISKKYVDSFIKLVGTTAERDKITSHPEEYYRKMFEMIPPEILKLYVAEYEGKIIAANLVLFFGRVATYMHGASGNDHRSVMAPYLLQWQAIQDAKYAGCTRYDFGGIKIGAADSSWSGIAKFKTGFAPGVEAIQFPGCYDIILKPAKYSLYRALQKIKRIL
jgi:peptidoglycan pentaglycine glycine transferase (the first glycine)